MGHTCYPHIQALFKSGLATHVVQNDGPVDRLFALSKIRDYPEVTFSCVFDDGTVVLGCHAALPDALASLAQPILPDVEEPEPPTDLAAMTEKLDDIARKLDNTDQSNAVLAKCHQLEAALMQLAERPASDAIAPEQVNRIEALIAQSQQTMQDTATTEAAYRNALLAQIATAQADHESTLHAAVRQDIDGLSQQLVSILAADTPLAELALKQTQMQQAISNMAKDLAAFCAIEGAATAQDDHANTAELQSQIKARLDTLDDVRTLLTATHDDVNHLSQSVGHLAAATSAATQEITGHMKEPFSQLMAQITALGQRPDPVIDVTEQRQVMVRFETAMATVLTRLETTTAALGDLPREFPDQSRINEAMETRLNDILECVHSITQLSDDMAGLRSAIDKKPDDTNEILQTLQALQNRPGPVLDMTQQRRSFAQFGTALATTLKRFESIADDLAAPGGIGQNHPQPDVDRPEAPDEVPTETPDIKPAAIFDSNAISFDDLRFQFAELIAAQFMDNALRQQDDTSQDR